LFKHIFDLTGHVICRAAPVIDSSAVKHGHGLSDTAGIARGSVWEGT
jgi:hypothetical protein